MDPKFVNKTLQTERVLREMHFAALGKLRLALYSIGTVFVLLTSTMLFYSKVFDIAIILAMMGILLILVGFIRPILAARQQVKRNAIMTGNNTPSPTELRFYDDKLVTFNHTIEKEISFAYDRFKKLKKTKHLFLLALPEQLYLIVERKGFTVGDESAFEAFIKEKIKK